MTGEQLKDLLYHEKISQSELARKLGMSQPLFHQALGAADIKSSLLEKIASALGKDMSFFYPIGGEKTTNQIIRHAHHFTGSGNMIESSSDKEVIAKLLEELTELRKQNQTLMNKLLEKFPG